MFQKGVMRVFTFGCPLYIASLVFLVGLVAAGYFLLRNCSEKVRRWVVLGLMLLNLFQHLFKPLIYPQYYGQGVTHLFTAYNMCATLIILAPFAMLSKGPFLKDFVFFTGSVAGVAAIAVPYWFIGEPLNELGWEYFRFYLCHSLLTVSCLMALLLRLHKPRFRDFVHISLGFFMSLCIILLNDFICISLGIYGSYRIENFYQCMVNSNPCAMMGPKGPGWILEIVKIFSPPVFLGQNKTGLYVPILWYAIPLFLGLNLVSIPLFAVCDREGWRHFLRKLRRK
jgi:uncharacterized membrane protein YwaF